MKHLRRSKRQRKKLIKKWGLGWIFLNPLHHPPPPPILITSWEQYEEVFGKPFVVNTGFDPPILCEEGDVLSFDVEVYRAKVEIP